MEMYHEDCCKDPETRATVNAVFNDAEAAYRMASLANLDEARETACAYEMEDTTEATAQRLLFQKYLEDAKNCTTWKKIYKLVEPGDLLGVGQFTVRPSGTWYSVDKVKPKLLVGVPPTVVDFTRYTMKTRLLRAHRA
jgi:hypothetical protein